MDRDPHFVALEKMYAAGPINELFQPVLEVGEGMASIDMEVSERFFHAGGALHGSVYFKMLDDAAFFAVNSLERDRFVLTTSFTLYIAEAVLTDSAGGEVARGSGVFVRSRIRLADTPGYEP